MMTRLIQGKALRLLSAGVLSFCSLTTASAQAGEVDAGKARLEAIKVELALLGDASAYAQPLAVRADGDGVEVQGTVPSEAVRLHVLEIARRSCYLPIRDRVAVAVVGGGARASFPLVKAAHDRLVRELGAQADAIKIVPEAGKLRLTGRVRSLEDKLHASRTLRGLAGCEGLLNHLEVRSDAGPSFTLITHAAAEPPAAPAVPAPPTPPVAEEVRPKSAPAPVATLPSGLPTPRDVPARPVVKQAPPVAEPQLSPVTPLIAAAPASPPVSEWPAHRTSLVTPSPAGALYQSHPLSRLTQAQPAAEPHPAGLKPVAAMSPADPKPAVATPPAEPKPVVDAPPADLKPVPPTPMVQRLVAPLLNRRKAAAAQQNAAELIRKVKEAAGPYARDVRTETAADGVTAVHVYAAPAGHQVLTAKLFDVPELMQADVRLHVHLPE